MHGGGARTFPPLPHGDAPGPSRPAERFAKSDERPACY